MEFDLFMPKRIHNITDIERVDYNNNVFSHRALVSEHVDKFNSLMDTELKKTIGNYRPNFESSMIDSIYNTGLSAFYCTAGTCPFLFKKNTEEIILEYFNKLLHLYVWCTKNKTASTYYESTVLLAKTLAPFIAKFGLLI